jgi:hypothetical protein
MFRVALSLLFIFVTCSGTSLAQIRKCVNEKGSVAFTNSGQCPEGYSLQSMMAGGDRGEDSEMTETASPEGGAAQSNYGQGRNVNDQQMQMYQDAQEALRQANARNGSSSAWMNSPERAQLMRAERQAFQLLSGSKPEKLEYPKTAIDSKGNISHHVGNGMYLDPNTGKVSPGIILKKESVK